MATRMFSLSLYLSFLIDFSFVSAMLLGCQRSNFCFLAVCVWMPRTYVFSSVFLIVTSMPESDLSSLIPEKWNTNQSGMAVMRL